MNTKSKLFLNNLAKNITVLGLMLAPLMQFNANRYNPYDFYSKTECRTIDTINDTGKPTFLINLLQKGRTIAEKIGLVTQKARYRVMDDNGKPVDFRNAMREKGHEVAQKITNKENTLKQFKTGMSYFKQGIKNTLKPHQMLQTLEKLPISVMAGAILVELAAIVVINRSYKALAQTAEQKDIEELLNRISNNSK